MRRYCTLPIALEYNRRLMLCVAQVVVPEARPTNSKHFKSTLFYVVEVRYSNMPGRALIYAVEHAERRGGDGMGGLPFGSMGTRS